MQVSIHLAWLTLEKRGQLRQRRDFLGGRIYPMVQGRKSVIIIGMN